MLVGLDAIIFPYNSGVQVWVLPNIGRHNIFQVDFCHLIVQESKLRCNPCEATLSAGTKYHGSCSAMLCIMEGVPAASSGGICWRPIMQLLCQWVLW